MKSKGEAANADPWVKATLKNIYMGAIVRKTQIEVEKCSEYPLGTPEKGFGIVKGWVDENKNIAGTINNATQGSQAAVDWEDSTPLKEYSIGMVNEFCLDIHIVGNNVKVVGK